MAFPGPWKALAVLPLLAPLTSGLPGVGTRQVDAAVPRPPIFFSEVRTQSSFGGGSRPQVTILSAEDLDNGNFSTAPPFEVDGAAPALNGRDIIGPDNRVLWEDRNFPYTAMGRLEGDDGRVCSASLIGPRHLATARHCVLPFTGRPVPRFRFGPNYYDTARLGYYYVSNIIHLPTNAQPTDPSGDNCYWKEDWAVLVLEQRAGDTHGFLGAKVIDPSTQLNRAMFFNLGYPQDPGGTRRPYRQDAISVRSASSCEPTGPLITDADVTPGNSGGTLWLLENGLRFQYGMCGAGSPGISLFSGGNRWLSAVNRARSDFP